MGGTAWSLTYAYDADGDRIAMNATSDYNLTFTYDGLDRMTGFPTGSEACWWRSATMPPGAAPGRPSLRAGRRRRPSATTMRGGCRG
jgi:hypothetical protein